MTTNVRDTSLRAFYGEIKQDLGQRHQQVLWAFTQRENFSNCELAHFLGWEINRVTPRVKELRDIGKLREAGKRTCKVTGRYVLVWELTTEDNQKKLFI